MTQSDLFDQRPVFQLKGGMLAATVLELTASHLPRLQQQLGARVAQAPQLFRGSPLILGLEKLADDDQPLDLAALLALCREQGLHPMAVRALRPADIAAAEALGLPVLPATRGRDKPVELAADPAVAAVASEPANEVAPPETAAAAPTEGRALAGTTGFEPAAPAAMPVTGRPSRVITQPVRGGQQIYAEGSDLIVLAAVSAGAEIIADGHIHCYGVLRGRALAGVKGDTSARIFCQQLEAELLAVAGHYGIAEDLRKHALWGKAVQAGLDNTTLSLSAL